MEIRPICRRDQDAVVDLLADGFAQELAQSGIGRSQVSAHVAAILATTNRPARLLLGARGWTMQFWVAVQDDQVIGCYGLTGREVLSISSVIVRKDLRGQGLGRRLMEHAFNSAQAAGRRRVVLEVLADNTPALGLYRSLGMAEYDSRTSYLPGVLPAAPESGGVKLVGVKRGYIERWPEIFRSNVGPAALQFEAAYRSDYVGSVSSRWLGEWMPYRNIRRAILVDGEVAGFTVVRHALGHVLSEVLRPLYLPTLRPHLRTVLALCAEQALATRAPRLRLYLSGSAEEDNAARSLGFVEECTWLQMYRQIG